MNTRQVLTVGQLHELHAPASALGPKNQPHTQFSKLDSGLCDDYSKCKIVDIRRGPKARNRQHFIYARLVNEKGELVINATLDYITQALAERLPKEA